MTMLDTTIPGGQTAHRSDHEVIAHYLSARTQAAAEGFLGDGSPADLTRLQSAVDTAVADTGILQLGYGDLDIVLTSGSPTINVSGDLIIQGVGEALTTIDVGPDPPTFLYRLFSIADGAKVLLRELTIEGPADPGSLTGSPAAPVYDCAAVYRVNGGAGSAMRLHNVTITGELSTPVQWAQGTGDDYFLELNDCDLTGYTEIVTFFADFNATNARYHARNTTFRDTNIASLGHLNYVHPHISILHEGCKYYGNDKYAVQHYSSSGGGVAPADFYAIFKDCMFGPNQTFGVLCSDKGPTQFIGGLTRNAMHRPRHDTVFSGHQGIVTDATGGVVDGSLQVAGRSVEYSGSLDVTGGGTGITVLGDDTLWNIDASMRVGDNSTGILQNNRSRLSGKVRFHGSGAATLRTVFGTTAMASFRGGFAEGEWASTGLFWLGADSGAGLYTDIDDMTFSPSTDLIVAYIANTASSGGAGSKGGKVRLGRNNRWTSGHPSASASTEVQDGELGAGSQSDKASAATVTIAIAGDLIPITGTATIDNLVIHSTAAQYCFNGATAKLLVQGAWSTSSSGNIVPRTTSARSVGTVVTLTYYAGTNKWYETA